MSLILVIEDDPRIQRALRRQFSAEGTTFISKAKVPPAGRVQSLRPATVVLDLMLPGLSGAQFAKKSKPGAPTSRSLC